MSSEKSVKSILEKYHSRILSVVHGAWAEWIDVSKCRLAKGYPPVLYSRTVANHVFDGIARLAISEFDGDSNVRVIVESQTIKLCFEQAVIARFKKGDDGNLGQNHPTQAVLDFIDPQGTLPGLPPAAEKIEFIWLGDDIGTEIEKVLVVSRDNNRLVWAYEIDEPGEGAQPIPLFPDPHSNDDEDGTDDLVKPKAWDEKSDEGE